MDSESLSVRSIFYKLEMKTTFGGYCADYKSFSAYSIEINFIFQAGIELYNSKIK